MTTSVSIPTSREDKLALAQAIALQVKRRNEQKTVYGIYRPSEKGPELIRCVQEQDGQYIEVNSHPTVTVPEKLEKVITTSKRFKVMFGGRSGAKSNTAGDILAAHSKDYGQKTLCLREMQNSIEDSVHALLASEIKRLDFDDFEVTQNAIRLKGEDVFKFKGLARNPDSVKSMFGFSRSWCEEAQSLSADSITMLTPTIREKDSELWFTLNPGSSEDPISKRFLEPFYDQLLAQGYYEDDLHLIIWINYTDNPWHSTELERERLFDQETLSKSAYDHKWLGYYNDDIEGALIEREWFDACIDAHKKIGTPAQWQRGAKFAAHDPSDTGPDSKGYAARQGSVVYSVEENLTGTINDGGDWACGLAIQQGIDHFTWDCDGMGVGLSRQVSDSFEAMPIQAYMFKGSESPDNPTALYEGGYNTGIEGHKTNKDVFRNKRAQYYQVLRDRCYKTYRAIAYGEVYPFDELISFSSEIPLLNKLRSEVCKMPVKPNGNGLIELYTKEQMKSKFNVASPNLGDSVMMLMTSPAGNNKKTKINFVGWG
jgi:phage terminase large subunit